MNPMIAVDSLSKRYRIGAQQAAYSTFRESLVHAVREPFNRLRRGYRSPENTIWALKDVSFNVGPGEVVGIIGRNGAGKSTLLKVLSRITEPTSGGIDLYGRVASLLEVGTGFHPELTGRENIYLNGAILGMSKAEISRKFDEMVAFAEVERFLDTPVKHYSSGMYVRIAFAVAAHLDAEILLVDEVLAAGDAAFQEKCIAKMRALVNDGRTILVASHQLETLQLLCPRSMRIEHGALAQVAETSVAIATHLERQATRDSA
jgi:lipopolysaccharide transport system ATP-binding protein